MCVCVSGPVTPGSPAQLQSLITEGWTATSGRTISQMRPGQLNTAAETLLVNLEHLFKVVM